MEFVLECSIRRSVTFFILGNRSKENTHMIILIDAEKAFNRSQHIFLENFLSKIRIDVYLKNFF